MRPIRYLMAVAAVSLASPSAHRFAPQWTPALWVDLVQMPVAVATLRVAGVPVADLDVVVPALNVGSVGPTLFLSSLRGITVIDGWGRSDDRQGFGSGVGEYVRWAHSRGLRGRALADAIHGELRRRDFTVAPERSRESGFDVLDPTFFGLALEGIPGQDEGAERGQRNARGVATAGAGGRGRGDELEARGSRGMRRDLEAGTVRGAAGSGTGTDRTERGRGGRGGGGP